MRAALVQLNVSDDPKANLGTSVGLVREAARAGAELILTPEVTNILSGSRTHQAAILQTEAEDATLKALRAVAKETGCHILIGSLALLSGDADGRFANRSFLIAPDGAIIARYDKIHMFDVELGAGESYHESASFRPGNKAVLAAMGSVKIGMTICYDLRFARLFRCLADAGASILSVPAAFTVPTGRAHWQVLLRARAIETGCFVLAPAQWGKHAARRGPVRRTYGHSLAINPWGEVIADGGEGVGVTLVDIDLDEVASARARVPSLRNSRDFDLA